MSEHLPPERESGQAAVESALVLPLMVSLGLGLLQLTQMQHAKLMTEYAAYCAARAGIVWNGNNERMQDAARVALLPTLGRTDDLTNLARTWTRARRQDEALQLLAWPTKDSVVPASVNGANLFGQVRVDTVNPSWYSPVRSVWKLRSAMSWEELDFDGPDAYPQVPALETKLAKFFNLPLPDDDEEVYRKATVLSVRVRYWYELRVPFANWFIFTSWWAANAGMALGGALDRPTLDSKARITHRKGGTRDVGLAPVRGLAHQRGYDTLYRSEMAVLWGLATGALPLLSRREGRHYFIPLTATYSMRMQSNFYFKWLMHLNPDWGM
ncbi:TadE/TadG family type IV pilus assembly protein [Vitiosangium sp. GDMCC 1.1324]|uniref:TadE/TadG family type IV pilus assembly protein n=1 Tax=Vitiosangium sp. (strain GDMCC 1.1324) TaxID=2138576 RepID=UPI001E63CBC6|nr:TadE/TadG family type IV pilus assembly protein [Vitiosangium sp. GDMCC 1.1324]